MLVVLIERRCLIWLRKLSDAAGSAGNVRLHNKLAVVLSGFASSVDCRQVGSCRFHKTAVFELVGEPINSQREAAISHSILSFYRHPHLFLSHEMNFFLRLERIPVFSR